ncbi:SLBB domain-containing protein [Halonatronum saccharophilum]|uniref:SLBB domain-containing protein n=1 Tax=Halonatronum saccharophilum TaxID=150060 RepID=UPI0004870FF7|nr:SLBB domain-containing protein [Halonatronum saccharophilum]
MKKSVLILIFIFTIIGAALPVEGADYRLQVDDRIYISIWGHNDLQREVRVDPSGMINFPLLGEVEVEGLKVSQVTDLIWEELINYIKIDRSYVNVTLKEYRRVRVRLLGEVANPGSYEIRGGDRVLDLISLAGGPTNRANLEDLRLNRKEESYNLNLKDLLEGNDNIDNMILKAGDTLYLGENSIEVNILGEIRSSGSYDLKEGSSIKDLIAKAGGVSSEASNKIEYTLNGESRSLDLRDILKGGDDNLNLEDGATLYINKSRFNPRRMSFWRNLFFFVGGINEINDLIN